MEQDEENTSLRTSRACIVRSRFVVPARLMSKYSRGICIDSPTAFLAAKWITASMGWLANTRPRA